MTISRIQLFSVPVSDQDRAIDFYIKTLGFDLLADVQLGPEMRWVQVRPKGADTGITLVTWFPTMPPGSLSGLVLETADLDAEVERLTVLGVRFANGIEDAPWGRFAQFTDPDGNGLIVQTTLADA